MVFASVRIKFHALILFAICALSQSFLYSHGFDLVITCSVFCNEIKKKKRSFLLDLRISCFSSGKKSFA
jgi:hypothetical protein